MANKKLIKKYEEFRPWPKQKVGYQKINESLSFRMLMKNTGWEEYTFHKYAQPCNKIVRGFYAHLRPVMGDKPTYSIVKGKDVPFTREILRSISIPDIPVKETSFTDRVNEKSRNFQRFRELGTNISDYDFNESSLKVGNLWKLYILVCNFIKYSIIPSSIATKFYPRDMVLLNMI